MVENGGAPVEPQEQCAAFLAQEHARHLQLRLVTFAGEAVRLADREALRGGQLQLQAVGDRAHQPGPAVLHQAGYVAGAEQAEGIAAFQPRHDAEDVRAEAQAETEDGQADVRSGGRADQVLEGRGRGGADVGAHVGEQHDPPVAVAGVGLAQQVEGAAQAAFHVGGAVLAQRIDGSVDRFLRAARREVERRGDRAAVGDDGDPVALVQVGRDLVQQPARECPRGDGLSVATGILPAHGAGHVDRQDQ
jgi:hypothetical protein